MLDAVGRTTEGVWGRSADEGQVGRAHHQTGDGRAPNVNDALPHSNVIAPTTLILDTIKCVRLECARGREYDAQLLKHSHQVCNYRPYRGLGGEGSCPSPIDKQGQYLCPRVAQGNRGQTNRNSEPPRSPHRDRGTGAMTVVSSPYAALSVDIEHRCTKQGNRVMV